MNPVVSKKAESVVNLLKERGLTIATAESCTGGLLSGAITSVSGASQVFELGVTSYSCRIKNEILGVDEETLRELGAVSEPTARQMAENVRKLAKSDIAASVTGVAGPLGSEGHPVGYIFIAVSSEKGTEVSLLNLENNGREAVREAAVAALFDLIENYVKGNLE